METKVQAARHSHKLQGVGLSRALPFPGRYPFQGVALRYDSLHRWCAFLSAKARPIAAQGNALGLARNDTGALKGRPNAGDGCAPSSHKHPLQQPLLPGLRLPHLLSHRPDLPVQRAQEARDRRLFVTMRKEEFELRQLRF